MEVTQQNRANALRILSIDAVQKANSGHPGAPMGMADIAEVLWHDVLHHNPNNPNWYNRDRFVLSNGHASILLYSLLYLTGYDLSIEDIKNFRQFNSKTPGHPEKDVTLGIETTTGPLGQGLANAVGMALAEKLLAHEFNRKNFEIIDHYTYVFVGDGCLMEGISHEVCSLAGTWKLNKLICCYDSNNISIDGEVSQWFIDDTVKRFKAYDWHVIDDVDGHDAAKILAALKLAKSNTTQPSLIIYKTVIGSGSPNKAGNHKIHGAPLGIDEIAAVRTNLNWQYDSFIIPDNIKNSWNKTEIGKSLQNKWEELFTQYQEKYPKLAQELVRRWKNELPLNFCADVDEIINKIPIAEVATRVSSQSCIENFAKLLPEMIGGSADLTSSNLTSWSQCKYITAENSYGNYINYGVREFGMSAIVNGIALYGGFIPFSATFLVFMDYSRNAVRMAAIMKVSSIFVYTHDSIGVGEDGPTHQPVEQLSSLRYTPNLHTWRPGNSLETAVAWKSSIIRKSGPCALVLSRQKIVKSNYTSKADLVSRGGYIIKAAINPSVIIIATGTELNLALNAADKAEQDFSIAVQVVSMPCVELFLEQNEEYKEQVLPSNIEKRIAVEASHADFWYKFVGLKGRVIALRSFGISAPADKIFSYFEITLPKIVAAIQDIAQ